MAKASWRASTWASGLAGAAAATSSRSATPGRLLCRAVHACCSGALALPLPAACCPAVAAEASLVAHWRRKVVAACGLPPSTRSTSSESTEVVPSQIGSTCRQQGGALQVTLDWVGEIKSEPPAARSTLAIMCSI